MLNGSLTRVDSDAISVAQWGSCLSFYSFMSSQSSGLRQENNVVQLVMPLYLDVDPSFQSPLCKGLESADFFLYLLLFLTLTC